MSAPNDELIAILAKLDEGDRNTILRALNEAKKGGADLDTEIDNALRAAVNYLLRFFRKFIIFFFLIPDDI